MNEHETNEIEQRLLAMRPAEPTPAVKQRIARSLETAEDQDAAPGPLIFRRPFVISLAAAAMIALAGVVSVWVIQHNAPSEVVTNNANPSSITEIETNQKTHARSSLIALTQAWNQSPETFDQLLEPIEPTVSGRSPLDTEPIGAD